MHVFAFEEANKSFSLVQSWKEYYSLEDWNLSMHAYTDIDGDNKKDMITLTNCAFLSTMSPDKIPLHKQCKEPGMSKIGFPDNSISVGQKLSPNEPFHYQWLKKSYLAKTEDNTWKFYDMNGLQQKVYELRENNLFEEVKPTLLDRIDATTYQTSHLGISLLFIVLAYLLY